jgi:hypothetical protein
MIPAALEIPLLGFPLRAQIDQRSFSFSQLWRATSADLSDAADDELYDWIDGIFLQFRTLEISLGCDDPSAPVAAASMLQRRRRRHRDRSRSTSTTGNRRPHEVPSEVLRFAPKRMRRDGVPMDQSGDSIIGMLHAAGSQLRAAEERINELETEIVRAQDRAVRAETWLQLIGREVDEKLVGPAAATRAEIDDLGP